MLRNLNYQKERESNSTSDPESPDSGTTSGREHALVPGMFAGSRSMVKPGGPSLVSPFQISGLSEMELVIWIATVSFLS